MEIVFNNVSYCYDKIINKVDSISNINVKIKDNDECIAILGPSGSGKTTFVKHINGLLFPSSGSIFIDNVKITVNNLYKIRKRIGYLMQNSEDQIFKNTVIDEVMYGPLNFNFGKEEAYRKAKYSLNLVNIDETYYNKYPLNLSGGEKRRIALASILSYEPDLLILDEPTIFMDKHSVDNFVNIINRIKKLNKIKVIFSTHDMNLVNKLAERCICLNEGKVIYDSSPFKLFQNRDIITSIGIDIPDIYKLQYALKDGNILRKTYSYTFNIKDILLDVKKWKNEYKK